MLAWMNAESLAETLSDRRGHLLVAVAGRAVAEGRDLGAYPAAGRARVDCDRDSLLLIVEQIGPACHTDRPSCFFTAVRDGEEVVIAEPV